MALSDAKAELVIAAHPPADRYRRRQRSVCADSLATERSRQEDRSPTNWRRCSATSRPCAPRTSRCAARRLPPRSRSRTATARITTNSDLRERLNEIAANVVRLTQTIASGDGAPLATADGAAESNGHGERRQPQPLAAAPDASEPQQAAASEGATLAERLRALQHAGARH